MKTALVLSVLIAALLAPMAAQASNGGSHIGPFYCPSRTDKIYKLPDLTNALIGGGIVKGSRTGVHLPEGNYIVLQDQRGSNLNSRAIICGEIASSGTDTWMVVTIILIVLLALSVLPTDLFTGTSLWRRQGG